VTIALAVIAYLLGSIPFGLLLTRAFGIGNLRQIGSGNIGATNVLRTGNKALALATLLLDGGKGGLFVLALSMIAPPAIMPSAESVAYLLFFGLCAIAGHCFPVWLNFKGGKGVATTLGVFLSVVPPAGIAACLAWLLCAFIFRISSLAALVAVLVAPLITFLIYGLYPAVICVAIAILVYIRHTQNIKRLLKGEEPKIGQKKE